MGRPLTCDKCGRELEPEDRFCQRCGQARSPSAYLDAAKQAEHDGAVSGGRKTPVSSAFAALFEDVRRATRGAYEIKRELGHGGMAAVYLAHHHVLNRPVALKVMLPFLALIEGMAQRFRDEARTAARLDHPNIVIIHSVEERDGLLFFAMKYINGCTLETALRRGGPMAIPAAQLVLVQVASALHYAHTEGVIHRDVKPSNVMLDRHGTPVVTDFGIAKAAESSKLTQTGSLLGTPIAMSPEQWKDKPATPKSDQYALGVLAYELLVGEPPFEGDRLSIREMHISQPPKPITDARPDCPPALAEAILRMLAKSPDDRWPSIADAIPALSAGLPGDLSSARKYLATIVARESGPRTTDDPSTPVSPLPTPTFPPRISKPEHTPVQLAVAAEDNAASAKTIVQPQVQADPQPKPQPPADAASARTIVEGMESIRITPRFENVEKHATPVEKATPLPITLEIKKTPVPPQPVIPERADERKLTPVVIPPSSPAPPPPVAEVREELKSTEPIVVGPTPTPWWARSGTIVAAAALVVLVLGTWIATALPSRSGSKAATVNFLIANGSVALGDTMKLQAVVRSAKGDTLPSDALTWQSSDQTIVTVNDAGQVIPHAVGTAQVSAVAGDARATALITVTHAAPNVSIAVAPADTQLTIGGVASFSAALRDADGGEVTGRAIRWVSSDTTVAVVDPASGRVTARASGSATITAADDHGARGVAAISVAAAKPAVHINASTRVLSLGATTLLTPSVRDSTGSVVQQGVRWSTSDRSVATVDSQGRVAALKLGRVRITAQTTAGASGSVDISVSNVATVSAGGDQTCALRTDGSRQCWMGGSGGQPFSAPRLEHITVGSTHACGLNASGEAFCWGENEDGQLGDGSSEDQSAPVRVSGTLRFRSISAGRAHTCGVTVTGSTYCWGSNAAGQLGTGSTNRARIPTIVIATEVATDVASGASHSCVIGQSGKVYCWGLGTAGQLGNGSKENSNVPKLVSGRETYAKLALGDQHTCGLTRDGEVLCWGSNGSGQLGNGADQDRNAPLHVKTSGRDRRQFSDIAAGANHTCALRRDSKRIACWGNGDGGQLGVEGATRLMTPTEISGTLTFRTVTAGGNHSCGVGADGALYCWGSTLRGRGASGLTRGKPTRMPNS